MSWWSRLAGRYTRPEHEDEAQELRARAGALGTVPVAEVPERARVEVCGVIRSLIRPPVTGSTLSFAAELYDGTGSVNVVWLGRRSVPGIAPGVHLRATGRVSTHGPTRVMFNPRYEILPTA